MSLRLGDKAPNFQAKTSAGDIDFYEYLGDSWGVLFSHPGDYTPVCTTELGRTAALKNEFEKTVFGFSPCNGRQSVATGASPWNTQQKLELS